MLRNAFFWVITQRVVVIQVSILTLEDGADSLSRNVREELPLLAV